MFSQARMNLFGTAAYNLDSLTARTARHGKLRHASLIDNKIAEPSTLNQMLGSPDRLKLLRK
jgi:hypothetical protein